LRAKSWSYRFAEEILNSKNVVKKELIQIVTSVATPYSELTRPRLNKELANRFRERGWESPPRIGGMDSRIDFLKDRIGVKIAFTHPTFLGMDLLKFQIASDSSLDLIDVGVYVVTTTDFRTALTKEYHLKWSDSLTFERVVEDLPSFKAVIHVPVYVIGLET
jgi:hypothetical protein